MIRPSVAVALLLAATIAGAIPAEAREAIVGHKPVHTQRVKTVHHRDDGRLAAPAAPTSFVPTGSIEAVHTIEGPASAPTSPASVVQPVVAIAPQSNATAVAIAGTQTDPHPAPSASVGSPVGGGPATHPAPVATILGSSCFALVMGLGLLRRRRRVRAVSQTAPFQTPAIEETLPLKFATSSAASLDAYPPAVASAPDDARRPVETTPRPSADAIDWTPIEDEVSPSKPATAAPQAPTHDVRESADVGMSGKAVPIAVSPAVEPWVRAGRSVVVAGTTITGGLIYFGSALPTQQGRALATNCLVDARYQVAKQVRGSLNVPYGPHYASLDANTRRAYIDWLAGARDDPQLPIGLVFLYLYGLERRLLLDQPDDRAVVLAEVDRLIGIYGEASYAFKAAAEALVAACAVGGPASPITPGTTFDRTMEVPWPVRLELGRLAVAGTPVPADLLLHYVMSHPETRTRTPAHRCLPLLRELFAAGLEAAYPGGLIIPRGKAKHGLSMRYRASNAAFELEISPPDAPLPDILMRAEPLALGRRLLDACTEQLDGYSRELGKAGGDPPSLAAIAKLPLQLRLATARRIALESLAALEALAAPAAVELKVVQQTVGLAEKPGKPGLAESASVVAKLGFGMVPDPAHTPRASRADGSVVVFRLERPCDVAAPSEAYRTAHLSLALGMMVAAADGTIDDAERSAMDLSVAKLEGLSTDDRVRLRADRFWLESHPTTLRDLRATLAATSEQVRRRLLGDAAAIASADGSVGAKEVGTLEKLAKQLELDPAEVYALLHGSTKTAAPAERASERSTSGIDMVRLAAIRAETLDAASILAEIFEEDDEPAPVIVTNGRSEVDQGLDDRHSALLAELKTQASWSRADFAALTKRHGLMPGSAREVLNEWSLDAYDELLLEGDDDIEVNLELDYELA